MPLSRNAKLLLFVVMCLITLPLLLSYLPVGRDWQNTYRPATLAVLEGKSPYTVKVYYAAPWAVIPLIPFALMPYEIGRLGLFIVGLAAFGYVAYKLGAKPPAMIIFLLSAAVIGCLNNGNIEWMPLLGIVLPPQFGLILLAVKPQVGVGLGIYWLIMIWREEGFKKVVLVFAPVTILLLISFALYGFWFMRFGQTVARSVDNQSLFPYGLFIGAVLLIRSIKQKNNKMAMASGPFFSPYVLQFTWSACLVYLLDNPVELLAAVICLWIPVILRVLA
ncbi:MAG: hypothetical protein JW730_07440 [Anaerolineales bacterium]|nr:hypothetical protein [Anaerolineales bacterium]